MYIWISINDKKGDYKIVFERVYQILKLAL
jgi:hypothetical protein